jgi:hypothetical protein
MMELKTYRSSPETLLRCGVACLMNNVISLESMRNQKAAKRGFKEWRRKFKGLPSLDEHTRWCDIPAEVILFLAEDDDGGRQLIHDLLMGALELGSGHQFESLPSEKLLPLLDVYFLLIDQVRFECMRRIGWADDIPLGDRPIIPLIRDYNQGTSPPLIITPKLIDGHPAYAEYARLPEMEQRVFLRKTIPDAIRLFRDKTVENN